MRTREPQRQIALITKRATDESRNRAIEIRVCENYGRVFPPISNETFFEQRRNPKRDGFAGCRTPGKCYGRNEWMLSQTDQLAAKSMD